jgi:hypothetical protein
MAADKDPTPAPGTAPVAAPGAAPSPAASAPEGASLSDEADRQRHANFLTSLFGLLAGAILFLPSILGIIKPPFIWNPLLYTFWVVGVLSLVCLGPTSSDFLNLSLTRTALVVQVFGSP